MCPYWRQIILLHAMIRTMFKKCWHVTNPMKYVEVNYNWSTPKSARGLQSTRFTKGMRCSLLWRDRQFSLLFSPPASPFCLAFITPKMQLHVTNKCTITLRRKGNIHIGSCPGDALKALRLQIAWCYLCNLNPETIKCHFLLPRRASIKYSA